MTRLAAIGVLDSAARPKAEVCVSPLASMALPNLGVVVFVVTLLHVLFLSAGGTSLFRDSDAGWHVRNGEAILAAGAVPTVDSFSYTREGTEWFAWEWLSDVLLGGAHRIAGLPAVTLLAAIAIAGSAWGAARLALSLGGNFFFTAGSSVLLLGVTSIHWLARPHIFSWGLALMFVAAAELERRKPSRLLYVLPLVACVWANLHGSFLLGPGILLIYAIGETIRSLSISLRLRPTGLALPARLLPLVAATSPQEGTRRRLFAACLVSLLATFINPYGWRLHEHVIDYLQNAYLMDHVSEFQSYSFHTIGSFYVELFLLAAVAGILLMVKQRSFARALLGVLLLHMALFSARHLPTAAMLLLPLSVAAFTREAGNWKPFSRMLAYSERLRTIDRKIWGIAPVILAIVASAAALQAASHSGKVGFSSQMFPVRAADYLSAHANGGRVFAKDQWGGYLIYRFSGSMKVFIDGRSDFYGRSFLETYADVADARPGWKAVLDRYGVQFVMAAPQSALVSVLRLSPEWKQVYADSVALVFKKIPAVTPPIARALSPRERVAEGRVRAPGSAATLAARFAAPSPGGKGRPSWVSLSGLRFTLLALVVVVAAVTDLRWRRIPNWITASGAALGLVFHLLEGGLSGVLLSIAGAALGFAIFIAFYVAGGMGAGDIKLFSAVGALTGPSALVTIFVFTGLLGGVAAVAAAIWHKRVRQTFIPYGAVIAAGTLLSLPVIH